MGHNCEAQTPDWGDSLPTWIKGMREIYLDFIGRK